MYVRGPRYVDSVRQRATPSRVSLAVDGLAGRARRGETGRRGIGHGRARPGRMGAWRGQDRPTRCAERGLGRGSGAESARPTNRRAGARPMDEDRDTGIVRRFPGGRPIGRFATGRAWNGFSRGPRPWRGRTSTEEHHPAHSLTLVEVGFRPRHPIAVAPSEPRSGSPAGCPGDSRAGSRAAAARPTSETRAHRALG